ncbi:hypothetical protein GCM10025881_35620 [Pseudolysinimonas kribbensis]|uniref:LPXTG cell wall anchor domain-containing protein n=1 Tax=Pseudolysinimonas kribbensis TaxID=433641 RepID=A0ABQ6KBG1_9MICO|nr:LPXTG cell wall anchor domain-containing protein [Pseudolysinimonas kribbensis]GMA96738.1 hypothetical protein GCM10025881_35620 [Pseudolysinimonas kribbensis]
MATMTPIRARRRASAGPAWRRASATPTRTSLGGGAKTAATNTQADCAYGAGLTIAGLSGIGASTLFPAGSFESTVYGNGGSVDAGPAGTTDPGSGGSVVDEEGQDGADGLVILRFAALPPKPELAATGMGVSTAIPALGAFALAGGAVLLALSRRRSRRA